MYRGQKTSLYLLQFLLCFAARLVVSIVPSPSVVLDLTFAVASIIAVLFCVHLVLVS